MRNPLPALSQLRAQASLQTSMVLAIQDVPESLKFWGNSVFASSDARPPPSRAVYKTVRSNSQ